jgi:DNA-binding transcriptional ArsR family regulator
MKNLERQYKALANRRRLAIIRYLKSHNKASVGEIAKEIGLRIKSTSKHLRILAVADFLDREQESLHVFYFLPSEKSTLLKQTLSLL